MRAYLIDPVAKTVTEIEHDESDGALQALLQSERRHIICMNAFILNGRDALYSPPGGGPPHYHYSFKGCLGPVYGRGLISGHTIDGEMCDPRTALKQVKKMVAFS